MGKVIVLGAKGRFGRAAVAAFCEAGWQVSAFGRKLVPAEFPHAECIEGNATDADAVTRACEGADVIVDATNPPYAAWARELPKLTQAVLAAARTSGATVLIPGNVYNYGAGMPAVLTEQTPWNPTTRKGKLRVTMERAFQEAGIPTIVLRGGDFLEPPATDTWFDRFITAKSAAGQTLYPGRRDVVHAWAFLPDMARAAVGLAAQRADFDRFEEFGFAGLSLTGQALIDQIAKATGIPQTPKSMPWMMVRLIGLFSPNVREVLEMRYLWDVPHQIDGSKLAATLPGFSATPVESAIAQSLAHLPLAIDKSR